MKRFNWRACAVLIPVLTVGAAVIVACYDSIVDSDRSGGGERGRVAHAAGVGAAAMRMRDEVHSRNKQDWVGVAHNRAIEDFVAELKKPGRLPGNLCDFTADFVSRPERFPTGKQFRRQQKHIDIAKEAVAASWLCRNPKVRQVAALSPAVLPQSSQASAFLGQIEAGIDASSSSYDFATRLQGILSSASELGETDRLAVETAGSVALNSYEYWEANYGSFLEAFVGEYGSCAENLVAQGWSPDDALISCTSGNAGAQVYWRGESSTRVRLASLPVLCGPGLKEGFKRIGKADLSGAWGGFWGGMFGGQPIAGALLGAAGSSIFASATNAAETWICLVQK